MRYRECPAGPARSETLARRRNLLLGNREISCLAVSQGTVRTGKAGGPKPVMHGHEKSGLPIVAVKPANEGGQPPEESGEPRGGAEGNARQRHAPDTEPGERVTRAGSRTAERRFAMPSNTPMWEPYAGNPLVRFCAGGAQ